VHCSVRQGIRYRGFAELTSNDLPRYAPALAATLLPSAVHHSDRTRRVCRAGAKPRDVCSTRGAFAASHAWADEVCLTLVSRSFVRYMESRKKSSHRRVREQAYTITDGACNACGTVAAMRNCFECGCYWGVTGWHR